MPPKPLDPPLEDTPLRAPDEVEPALRLATDDEERGTELMLLPADAALTWLAMLADLFVAALTRALASEAALVVAAVPPPVPAP